MKFAIKNIYTYFPLDKLGLRIGVRETTCIMKIRNLQWARFISQMLLLLRMPSFVITEKVSNIKKSFIFMNKKEDVLV